MSNAPRIYVRGSYIDIHDNENVYLTVDKEGEVKTRIDEKQLAKKADAPATCEPPEELRTPRAIDLRERLTEAGLTDGAWQPVALSNAEKGMLAFYLSDKLGISSQWKVFAALWGMNAETLRRAYNKALDQNKSLAFQDRLKEVI